MGIAGAAYGAAKTLEQLVMERRLQQALTAEIENRNRALTEQNRSNQVQEGLRSREIDVQEKNLNENRAFRQSTEQKQEGEDAFRNAMPGRVEEPVAAKIRQNPTFGALLKTSQSLPEQEGVGPLPEPETQRPELFQEKQQRVTNERLLEQQRLADEDRNEARADRERAYNESVRQFGINSAEARRLHDMMNADRDASLAARTTHRPATGVQRTALGFYNRMDSALKDMDAVEDKLSPKDLALINDSPLPNLINNSLLSSAGQQYVQALRTYTEARLRKESGAAIAPHEFAQDRLAISRQVGDQEPSIKQKRATRRQTAEGIAFAAGPAYEEYYGEPFQRGGGTGTEIDMVDPQGKPLRVPLKDIEAAIAAGAKVKQ